MDIRETKEHIRVLEESLLEPNVRMSPEAVDSLLAMTFFEFGSSGRVLSRADCVGGLGTDQMSLYDFDIQVLAKDLVLATYKVKNETLNRHTLRSSIWKQFDGRWKMVFHQGTIIPT